VLVVAIPDAAVGAVIVILLPSPMTAVAAMAAMAAMAEHVEKGTSKQKDERQNAEEVSPMFREQEKGDDDEAGECPPGSRSSGGITHGMPLLIGSRESWRSW